MADWTTAVAADGPKVEAWIAENLEVPHEDTTGRRRLSDWRRGGRADFYSLDRLLTRYDKHVSQLPEDVWLSTAPRVKGAGIRRGPKHVRQPLEPKPCQGCGKQIPFHGPNGRPHPPSYYRRAKFCCRECQWVAKDDSPRPRFEVAA